MSPTKKAQSQPAPAKRPAARAARPAEPGLDLALGDIQTLIGLIGREPIDEFEFESRGVRLHIRKLTGSAPAAPAAAPVQAFPPPAAAAPAPPAPAQAVPAAPQEEPGLHHITSPIVGTFYRAPSANAAPFVQPGDFVKPGQTLCIVEAMKLMNEIECDVAGEVVAVLAENGQPVEYGERLFAIRVR
jgi:acetyl-CoA carboxylase biotin carboxyl carrier protein